MEWLVNTGASPNVLDKKSYDLIDPRLRPSLKPISVDFRAAEGSFLKVHGEADFEICLNKKFFVIKFVVAELDELKGIIGMQFLNSIACTIDIVHGVLTIDGTQIQMQRNDGPDCCRIRLSQKCTLAPGREHVISGVVDSSKWESKETFGFVEAVESFAGQT